MENYVQKENGVHIHFNYICDFAYLTDIDVNLLQIKFYCCKANHTIQLIEWEMIYVFVVKYSPY
jgi:hypothetical protein